MPASKAKHLKRLLRSAVKTTSSSSTSASVSTSADDITLKEYVSSLNTSPPLSVLTIDAPSRSKSSFPKPLSELALESRKFDNSASLSDDSTKQLSKKFSSILCGDSVDSAESQVSDDEKPLEDLLDIPWFAPRSHDNISLRRKEVSRMRKQKWVFKSTQRNRFDRLVRMCTQKLGADATIQVFGKLGRETGVKEYNALIRQCIEKARESEDEEVSLEMLSKAFKLIVSMREKGFQVEEESYGPLLMYVIDMGMAHKEFGWFCEYIKDENPNSFSRLAYYEMLLWVRDGNEDKIQELCNSIADNDDGDVSDFRENYLLALCKGDREKEVLLLLESFDITKVTLPGSMTRIFKALGRLLLESFAKKFMMELKTDDIEALDNVSNFIYDYASSMPNLAVEDVVLKFENLHAELEVTPSPVPYEKLIRNCCESLKVHVALGIVDRMFEAGLTLPINTFHCILNACYESCEYNLVHRIYSLICRHNLKPNNETFRCMISLCVKMKDFDGAYGMLKDLEKMNLMPTASMYNAIMGGYFREKKFNGGLMVLKQMEAADVKPDAQTFSYIIGNCNCEEDIIKYHKELKDSGVQVTKHVFMALINAYASCGLFEKAKQVVLEKGVPVKGLNEIKSVLVSALALHGQMSDALNIYEEIKQVEDDLKPKAIISLIENLQSEGKLSRLLLLLKELNDPGYWVDGCFRIISYCVRHKDLSSVVDLLKQLMEKFCSNGLGTENLFDEVFCQIAETEPTDVQFGLDLLKAIKEDIGLQPSRKSLDFLLSACVNAKDLPSSFTVWKEYETASLPYNVLSFVRMYQALLASGDHKTATTMLGKIPNDDRDVCLVVKACQDTYRKIVQGKKKKKKKKTA